MARAQEPTEKFFAEQLRCETMHVEIKGVIQRVDQAENGRDEKIDRERLLDAQCGYDEAKRRVGQGGDEEKREIGQHKNGHLSIEKMRSSLVLKRLIDGLNSIALSTSVYGNTSQRKQHDACREDSDGDDGHNLPVLFEETNVPRVLSAGSTVACHS